MKAGPDPFLNALTPDREDVVVCVECLFTGYWLADRCAREGIPFVLGHALSRKAIHGGKATHDTLEAQTMAVLRRGGMLPQASVDPAERRATRDWLRRRMSLRRQRADLLTHVQQTTRPYNRPAMGQQLASTANRDRVAERCPAPAVQKRIAVDLALIAADDRWRTTLERDRVQTATAHEAQTFSRVRAIPGVGKILALVLRDEIHEMRRFPRVQEVVASGRFVTWAKESAGKRDGTAGQNIGQASRTGACSAAAVLFRRNHPAGPKYLARLAKHHGKGQPLTSFAHQVARAVYAMVTRDTAVDLDTFLREYGVEWASLTPHGTPWGSACSPRSSVAQPLRLGTRRSA